MQFRIPIDSNIYIKDKDAFWKKLIQIKKEGAQCLQFISDFDYTLSCFYEQSYVRNPSTHSLISTSDELDEEYKKRSAAINQFYYPFEIDTNLDKEKKAELMKQWWAKSHDVLIEAGITRNDIERAVKESSIRIREYAVELINTCREMKIPFLLFSAGLAEVLREIIKQKCHIPIGKEYSVEIVSNEMIFDESGKLIGFQDHIINSTNKNMANRSYVSRQKERENLILMGDNLGDISMSDGVKFKTCLSIGLLNDEVEQRLEAYMNTFDVVIANDSDLKFVVDLVQYLGREDDFPCLKDMDDEGEECIVVPPSIG